MELPLPSDVGTPKRLLRLNPAQIILQRLAPEHQQSSETRQSMATRPPWGSGAPNAVQGVECRASGSERN